MPYSLAKCLRMTTLVTGCAFISILSYAQPVYKWQDAKGATHYTQTPPPAGANAKTVDVRSRTNLQPVTLAPSVADTSTQATNKAPAAPQKPRLKAEDCQQLRNTLDTLNTGRRIYESDKNGERAYLTEEQRTERISTYTKNLAEACS